MTSEHLPEKVELKSTKTGSKQSQGARNIDQAISTEKKSSQMQLESKRKNAVAEWHMLCVRS